MSAGFLSDIVPKMVLETYIVITSKAWRLCTPLQHAMVVLSVSFFNRVRCADFHLNAPLHLLYHLGDSVR